MLNETGKKHLGKSWWDVTLGELIRFIGCLHQMRVCPRRGGRCAYWDVKKAAPLMGFGDLEPPTFSFTDVMGLKRFEQIYTVFYVPTHGDAEEPFDGVCRFTEECCRTWQKFYVPSKTLVADESMLVLMGKHMPGWIIVPRKPKPQGLEWKTLCDAKTKLLLNIDIQKGKLRNAAKEFNDTHKRSTGCT